MIFGRLKNFILKTKIIIIILLVLVIVGWSLTIYFGTKTNSSKDFCVKSEEKLEKLNYYASLLAKSMQLIRQEKGLEVLEDDVRLLDNGTLLAEWEDVVFSGNKEEDVDAYLDVIIDSLNFFSK